MCHHASGAPAALAVHQGAKGDCEMPGARELLENVQPSLEGAVLTSDALHCQKHGCRFPAIDLRWRASEEAAVDQSTMRTCRAGIARCQAVSPSQLRLNPYFVSLCLHERREREAQQ